MSEALPQCTSCKDEVMALGLPEGTEALWVINVRSSGCSPLSPGVTSKICTNCALKLAMLGIALHGRNA